MPEDLRILAVTHAAELEAMAAAYPAGDPGRVWLLKTATRLKNAYCRPRPWQMWAVMYHVSQGCRTVADLIDELGQSRRDMREMLAVLIEMGYLTERANKVEGEPGRPATWYELTAEGEIMAGSFEQ
jgi:hypothetical protein